MPESAAAPLVIVPAPLDALVVPAALDGHNGANRATGRHAQIAAMNDLDALRAWLARFADTKTTFENGFVAIRRPAMLPATKRTA